MTVTVCEPEDFSLANLQRVALQGETFRYAPQVLTRIATWHKEFKKYATENKHRFIYGVTSGYGPRANERIDPYAGGDKINPFIGLSFGESPWPDSHVRAMLFSLAAMVVHGAPALSVAQAKSIATALKRPLPRIPQGGITSPGEMMVLFYFEHAIPELSGQLQCSLCNGAVGSVAVAGLRALAARRRVLLAEQIFALSAEAIRCPLEHFHPGLKALWGDVYEAQSIDAFNHWLQGSSSKGRRPFQAPVSYRILPRVLGQARRASTALETAAETALQGMVTNPTYVTQGHKGGEKTLSTAGFHEALPAQALDNMMASWVDLASIAHRHLNKLHKGGVSKLPDRLTKADEPSTAYLEYVAGDMEEEMRRLAQPTLLSPGDPGASDQDDVNSPGFIACRMEARVSRLLDRVLTLLAVTASQALFVTGRPAPPNLRGLLKVVRKHFPVVTARRNLGCDAERLSDIFTEHAETARALR